MVSLSFTSLTTLINRDDLPAFTSFLNNRNVAVDDRDENGTTAMMVAAERGLAPFIHALVEFGADVNTSDLDNWTALHNAAKEGHAECVRELLEAGANTEMKDMGGWTPLLWAVYQHRTETARVLVEAGANVNVPGQHHMTALVWAAGRGYLDMAQLLLASGAKVNINDKFGTSPLIWACRKGFTDIVAELLKSGANVDQSGMYSWTPLLLAVKGGHTEIVDMLVAHRPNLNVVDKDGITPLIMAAKEGSLEITTLLVGAGAYINLQDKCGDTALICAARGGHSAIVELLLKKYADINICGKDHKTALYWAVEKNHIDAVKLLLGVHADTESSTKEGDTPLLRAVRNRQADMVELLLDRKARITVADIKGDTCLHIAMRARSRHIVEILLRNPKHSKMLYRPNKSGETPYNIDIGHKRAILGDIFGARKLNTNEENENRLGYDLYSGALADFLSEPSLTVPISVGLYAKWGSGKSFLLGKLTEEMRNFAQQWLDPVLELSTFLMFLLLNLALLFGVAFGIGFCNLSVGMAVGCSVAVLLIVAVLIVKYFGNRWEYEGLYGANTRMARMVGYLQLLARITFCHPPGPKARRDKMRQIRFFFAQRASVPSAGRGDNSIVEMINTLYEDIEQHCGIFACRLFRAFRPQPVSAESEAAFRHLCLVPYAFIFLWTVYVAMACLALTVHFFTWEPIKAARQQAQVLSGGVNGSSAVGPPIEVDSGDSSTYKTIETLLIVLSVTLGVVLITNVLTIGKVLYALIAPHRLHLQKLLHSGGGGQEGYVQALKEEVTLLINMVRCMDSMTDEQTRLVVVVDGLDSCEQEKVLEILDMVNTLFTAPNAPFVILLSIDPHVISKAVELNINKVFSQTAISGNDYLKNLIHLPFFLQNSALRKVNLAQRVAASRERRDTWIDAESDPMGQQTSVASRRLSVESVTTGAVSKSRLRLPKKTALSRLKGTESVASSVASNLNSEAPPSTHSGSTPVTEAKKRKGIMRNKNAVSPKSRNPGQQTSPAEGHVGGNVVEDSSSCVRTEKACSVKRGSPRQSTGNARRKDATFAIEIEDSTTSEVIQNSTSTTENSTPTTANSTSTTSQSTEDDASLPVTILQSYVPADNLQSYVPDVSLQGYAPTGNGPTPQDNNSDDSNDSGDTPTADLPLVSDKALSLPELSGPTTSPASGAATPEPERKLSRDELLAMGKSVKNRRLTMYGLANTVKSLQHLMPKKERRRSADLDSRLGSSLVTGTSDLNRVLLTDDYFSDVNPRSMRRLMNVIYISGRLVKAFHIDFNWYHLASWINITEQWPYHTTWMILYFEYNESKLEDRMSLYELYTKIRGHIPTTREADPLCEYDRDEKKLDVFLSFHKHTLTLADMKIFLPFTINLDPYIKKVVKEEYFDPVEGQLEAASPQMPALMQVNKPPGSFPAVTPPSSRSGPGKVAPGMAGPPWPWLYPPGWTPPPPMSESRSSSPAATPRSQPKLQLPAICNDRLLSTMSVDDVCHLVAGLQCISSEVAAKYHRTLRHNNISGWVLCACNLHALKKTLKMTFGDWETFRAAVETLRERELGGIASGTSGDVTGATGAGADTKGRIRFQLSADTGKAAQGGSNAPSSATSPTPSESRSLPAATSSSGPPTGRRRTTENRIEKQVTLEEQMIWGALQTLNEDACEDLREDQEVMADAEASKPLSPIADGGESEDHQEMAVMYLQRSPGSPPTAGGVEEMVNSAHSISPSTSVLTVTVAASPERRRHRTISVHPVRPSSLVAASANAGPRSPSLPADEAADAARISLSVASSQNDLPAATKQAPGSPRQKLSQLKEYLSRTLPQKPRVTPNGEVEAGATEATPLVEMVDVGPASGSSQQRQQQKPQQQHTQQQDKQQQQQRPQHQKSEQKTKQKADVKRKDKTEARPPIERAETVPAVETTPLMPRDADVDV